jgi:prepilin-type processing-associated H-X9-DG protein
MAPLQTGSWAYQLLPFLEQVALWQEGTNANKTPVKIFFCPSRRGAQIYGSGLAEMDYSGSVCGDGPANDFGVLRVGTNAPPAGLRLTDITDGTSSTMVIAEKRLRPIWYTSDAWCDYGDGYTWGASCETTRDATLQPTADINSDQSSLTALDWQFGSAHPGAMNALFADGSVRPISYLISQQTFQNLANYADGAVLGSDAP